MHLFCNGRSHTISLRNLDFHYLEWGDPNHPTLLLLHGFLDFSHSFDLLAEQLVDKFHLIAWDARGHGQSGWIHRSGYYHFVDYVYDLALLIEYLKIENPILVGHSMGGMIASLYAGTYPEKVKGLVNMEGWVLLDSPFSVAPERVRLWIEQVQAGKSFRPFQTIEEAVRRLKKTDPLVSEEVAQHLAIKGTRQVGDMLEWRHDPLHRTRNPQPFYLKQAEAFWNQITCPTLLLEGALSRANQLPDRDLRLAAFPNSRSQTIPEAAHNLHLHQPQTVAIAIRNFVEAL